MAIVVNSTDIRRAFIDLGWDGLNLAETASWIHSSGINPSGFLAYCLALLAAKTGLDDSTISGVDPGQVPYIREWLQSQGVVF